MGDSAPDFLDLVHNRLEHGSVTVGLEFESGDTSGPIRIEATIQNIDEWQTQVISRWTLRSFAGNVTLEWLGEEDDESDKRRYRFSDQDETRS